MNILWVTNILFPDLSKSLGNNSPIVGGWMFGLAADLVHRGFNLTIATSSRNYKDQHASINGIEYYLLTCKKPITNYDETLENKWQKIVQQVKPDIVHIHGTEYAHGLALMKACPSLNYVISIQGLIGAISRYYLSNISLKDIIKNITLRDIIKQDSILQAKFKFAKRGKEIEKEYLCLGTDIIGRTQWDHDHVKVINPNINYHFCNESLRDVFYQSPKWNLQNKTDHTIFLSQASYPIKGLHKVLEAIHLIKKIYPNIQLRIAGENITKAETFKDRLRQGGYAKYIKKLVDNLNLQNSIIFLGPLDANAMVNEYLKCHIFVCPSSIENSPNSLGEAQLLGVPCIASYVGGIPNMVTDRENGLLYRFEEVEMLAHHIKEVFNDKQLANRISCGGIQSATKRHDRELNTERTIEIYKSIISSRTSNLN